jgi:hypothetical protein
LAVPAFAAQQEKVSFCHRTDSESNPYVAQSDDGNSIISHGHGDHTGPIFPKEGPDGKWGDIIPRFDYDGGHFPGLNWTVEGEEILNAGCDVDLGAGNPCLGTREQAEASRVSGRRNPRAAWLDGPGPSQIPRPLKLEGGSCFSDPGSLSLADRVF